MGQSERACLAIADISGYTSYLTGVELDHAEDVVADLLHAIVDPLRPNFHLAGLEGDAAFMYAPVDSLDGSLVLDLVEACYFSFRRRVRSIQQASSCECNACLRIPDLDLKLIVHHGDVIRHEVLGAQRLVGSDVIIAHRLLKNRIVEELGLQAYALLTDACIAATALDPGALDMVRYEEDYDHVGRLGGWVHDLHRAWEVEHERQRVYVSPQDALWVREGFVADASPGLAWEWMTTPARKLQWELGFDDVFEVLSPGGRRGPGGETHCVHGDDLIVNEIVDWRPPRYVTSVGQFPNGVAYIVTDEVVAQEGGVLVRKSMRAPSAETREPLGEMLAAMGPVMDPWIPTLVQLVGDAHASRGPVPESDLPVADEHARLATSVEAP